METNAVDAAVETAGGCPMMPIYVEWIQPFAMKVVMALVVVIVGFWIAKIIKNGVVKLLQKRDVDPALISFVASLSYFALKVFVVVTALDKLDVRTASFVAIIGAAGLAIGLALQGSLSNFSSGVLIIIFKPFGLGDFVEAGGEAGVIEEIGIFTTVMKTPDNKKVIVPNASIMGGSITNYNANGTRRVDLVAGIGYSDDIDQAKTVLEDILAKDDRILKDPAPTIAVVELGDSSVNLVVRPWVNGADYWDVYFDVTETIKKRFDEEEISIPFPQRDVHVYEHKNA